MGCACTKKSTADPRPMDDELSDIGVEVEESRPPSPRPRKWSDCDPNNIEVVPIIRKASCPLRHKSVSFKQEHIAAAFGDDKYYGTMLEGGVRHGKGILQKPNGDVYDGDWKDNAMNGSGTYMFANGTQYLGTFINDKQDGNGTLTSPGGPKYDGQWKDGRRNGKGREESPDGAVYKGDWVGGLREGTGAMRYADGTTYVGKWKEDLRHGTGQYKGSDGTTLMGDFTNDALPTYGTVVYSITKKYTGCLDDAGRPHGEGVLVVREEASSILGFLGFFSHGTLHGSVREFCLGNQVWDGQYDNGVRGEGAVRRATSKDLMRPPKPPVIMMSPPQLPPLETPPGT